MVRRRFQHVGFRNLFQAAVKVARFILQQLAPHLRSFLPLFQINPMPNLALRVRRLDEAQPVPVGVVIFLRQNFHYVTAGYFVPQRNHLPVHLRARALVPYFGVHRIREVHRRRPARQFQHTPFGRKRINLHRREVHVEGGQKFAGLFQFLRPLNQLPHPRDALVLLV